MFISRVLLNLITLKNFNELYTIFFQMHASTILSFSIKVLLMVYFFINTDDVVNWSSWKVGEVYPPSSQQGCESTTSRKPELNLDQVLSHCKSETFRDETRKRIQKLETRLNECSIIDMPVKHTPLETQYPLAFSILFHRCLWLMIS